MWLTWIWSSVSPLMISSTGIAAPAHPLLGTAGKGILDARRSAFLTANMMLPSERRLKSQKKWLLFCSFKLLVTVEFSLCQHQHGCFFLISATYRPLLDWSGKDAHWENVESIEINVMTRALSFYNKNNWSKHLKRVGIIIAHYASTCSMSVSTFKISGIADFEVRLLMKRFWFFF